MALPGSGQRTTMKAIPLLMFFLLTTAAVTAERTVSLPELLDRHEDALGAPLRSAQIELRIEEPTFTVTATYVAHRDGRMRIDVFDEGLRVFSEALDGDGGWQWQAGGGAMALSDAGRATLERGIVGNLYGLHERPSLGYLLELQGVVTIDGRCYWKVLSRAPDGFEKLLFLDTATALVEREQEVSALHPDVDEAKQTVLTRVSDFRSQDGRTLPFRSEKVDAVTGDWLQRIRITRFVADPELPDEIFAADGPVLGPPPAR